MSQALSSDVPKAQKPAASLDGKWALTSAELAGNPFPKALLDSFTLILDKGHYTLKSPSPDDKGTTKIDDTKTPKELDIKGEEGPNKGKTMLAIYELDGDTLKVCYDLEGKKRPTEFKTASGTKQFLAQYKRVKE